MKVADVLVEILLRVKHLVTRPTLHTGRRRYLGRRNGLSRTLLLRSLLRRLPGDPLLVGLGRGVQLGRQKDDLLDCEANDKMEAGVLARYQNRGSYLDIHVLVESHGKVAASEMGLGERVEGGKLGDGGGDSKGKRGAVENDGTLDVFLGARAVYDIGLNGKVRKAHCVV